MFAPSIRAKHLSAKTPCRQPFIDALNQQADAAHAVMYNAGQQLFCWTYEKDLVKQAEQFAIYTAKREAAEMRFNASITERDELLAVEARFKKRMRELAFAEASGAGC